MIRKLMSEVILLVIASLAIVSIISVLNFALTTPVDPQIEPNRIATIKWSTIILTNTSLFVLGWGLLSGLQKRIARIKQLEKKLYEIREEEQDSV
jgi:hypothetical protein